MSKLLRLLTVALRRIGRLAAADPALAQTKPP